MFKPIRYALVLLLLLAMLPCGSLAGDDVQVQDPAELAREELLARQSTFAWLQINAARQNPQATAERLGISWDQVVAVFGDDAAALEAGLAPLAWNEQLQAASSHHGRDMFSRVYYSHVSPEGNGPADRVASTGYQAQNAKETLAALVFSNYVEVAPAVSFMLDTMMRDELTGAAGVPRNIFSAEVTEVGISFFAESIPLLAGAPYVYLFVLDFAAPLEPRKLLIGQFDEGRIPLIKVLDGGFWYYLPVIKAGVFQGTLPAGGAEVVLISNEGQLQISDPVTVFDDGSMANRAIDLRGVAMHEYGAQ